MSRHCRALGGAGQVSAMLHGESLRKALGLFALVLVCWLSAVPAAHAAKIKCLVANGTSEATYADLCNHVTEAYPAGGPVDVTIDNTTLLGSVPITEEALNGYDMVMIATVYRRAGDLPAVDPIHWPVIESAIQNRLSKSFWFMTDGCCGLENLQAAIDITNRASDGLFNLSIGAFVNGRVAVNRNPQSNFTASFTQPNLFANVFSYFSGAPIGYVLYGQGTTGVEIGAVNEEVILPSARSFGGTGACIFLGSDVNVVATEPAQAAMLIKSHFEAALSGGSCGAAPPARPTISMAFNPSYLSYAGGTTRLTITIGNSNADPLIVQSAALALPSSVTIAATANATTTCRDATDSGAAAVTAANGGNVIGLPASSLIPTGGCTISVDITAQPGSYSITLRAADFLTSSGLPAGDASLTLGPPPPAAPTSIPVDSPWFLTVTGLLIALLGARAKRTF